MLWFRTIVIGLLVAATAGCGFQPLYGGGKKGRATTELASIRIEPIVDRSGQLLRNELFDLLNPYGSPTQPLYRLSVTISEGKSELAVKKSEIATRANLRITASYTLYNVETSQSVFSGTSSVVGSYNVLDSEYATLIAEKDARSRVIPEVARDIQTRLSAYFRLRKPAATPPTAP